MTGRKIIVNALALSTLVLGLTWFGCNKDDTGNPTGSGPVTIAKADSLKAWSVSETSIGVSWLPSPDEARSEVLNPAYSVTCTDTVGSFFQLTAPKGGQNRLTFTSLVEGRVYTFTIKVLVASGAESNDSSTVKWAPAKRRQNDGDANYHVFETASTTFPSGLDIYNSTADGPVTFSLTGSSNGLIDLFVATDGSSSDLLIRSASLSQVIPVPKTTFFSTVSVASDDLENPQIAPPDVGTYSTLELRVSSATSATGRIFFGRTLENNYFRLLVVRNGSSLIFGTSPDRFITVRISYQSVSGVRYSRPINKEPEELTPVTNN